MPQARSPMDILKLFDKSNCRQCNEPTCLAFAAAVFKGRKPISDCPRVDKELAEAFGGQPVEQPRTSEQEIEAFMHRLQEKISGVDLAAAADRLGAKYENGRLTLKVLGKNVSVDADGKLYSDIHTNPWIAVPILTYIIDGAGKPPSGQLVPFRELKNGGPGYGLFRQRCEKPLKKIADTDIELFTNLLDIFNARPTEHLDADIARVMHPLPRVPMMICYWKAEEGFDSNLQLYFDKVADENLNVQSINAMGAGIARMFEKLAEKHGLPQSEAERQRA